MSGYRDVNRDMQRVASLYNGVVLEQLLSMHWEYLVDSSMTEEGKLRLDCQTCHRPVEEQPLFGPEVRENVKRTAISVNSCITAIDYNTAWLAFCVKDLQFEIKEVTFFNPKPTRKVELWYIGEQTPTKTDYAHTVLKLTPENGEEAIVADATYAQYSFENGIDTYCAYCASKILHRNPHRIREDRFGHAFEDYCAYEGHVWEQSRADAVIRTTNNVMIGELATVGGIEGLLGMSAENFQDARDNIFAAMKAEMEALRRRFEGIFYGNADLILMQLADIVEDCDGHGHQLCTQSFQRR